MQYTSNATQCISITMHRNAKFKEYEEISVVERMSKENGRLVALGFLVSQQLAVPVVFFVTGLTFVLLLWRPTRCFSAREHVGVVSIFTGEGFPPNKDREGSFLVDVVYSADSSDPCCHTISHNVARCRKTSFPLDHVFSDEALRSKHPHQSNHIYYT